MGNNKSKANLFYDVGINPKKVDIVEISFHNSTTSRVLGCDGEEAKVFVDLLSKFNDVPRMVTVAGDAEDLRLVSHPIKITLYQTSGKTKHQFYQFYLDMSGNSLYYYFWSFLHYSGSCYEYKSEFTELLRDCVIALLHINNT